MTNLITPHGGVLVDLFGDLDPASLREQALNLPDWTLSERQLCDIELLLNGGFSPLTGFMVEADYQRVLDDMRLRDGTLWPMPITLDVDPVFAKKIGEHEHIALRDPEGVLIALMRVESIWTPDKDQEAQKVFGSQDRAHPGVNYLHAKAGAVYIGGAVQGVEGPAHFDYRQYRFSPRQLRDELTRRGWTRVVAFQTRNPMHRAHYELTHRAAKSAEANLLIHPVVGMTKPGDVDHYTRVRCYEHILKHYPDQTTALSLLPLAMRMGGPREALWHAIIRRNYGCTHFIVGRDHAGPGKDSQGKDFYGPYDAQVLVAKHEEEIGVRMVPFKAVVYVENKAQYQPITDVSKDDKVLQISGTELRRRLQEGLDIAPWFSYPEVISELRKTHPARHRQGFTVFLTGLSGAGKSTIANALLVKLLELGGRPVTLLDGDIVRTHLSSELGFSKAHRDLNILRIGFVASQITKNGGVAICAPIAPYAQARQEVRALIEPTGGFMEVHVSTPLAVCERRDRKGLYSKARAGLIKGFTGIDDPYEAPAAPELRIDTTQCPVEEAAQRIILKLESLGYIK